MRKVIMGITGAVVLLFAGILAWNAEATALAGTISVQAGTNYSLVQKAGCRLPGFCPRGEDLVNGRCVACAKPRRAVVPLRTEPGLACCRCPCCIVVGTRRRCCH